MAKALLRPISIKFLGHALWRPFDLRPEFTAKQKASYCYIIQVSFLKTAFLGRQTFLDSKVLKIKNCGKFHQYSICGLSI